jgi:hypothetical protein
MTLDDLIARLAPTPLAACLFCLTGYIALVLSVLLLVAAISHI